MKPQPKDGDYPHGGNSVEGQAKILTGHELILKGKLAVLLPWFF